GIVECLRRVLLGRLIGRHKPFQCCLPSIVRSPSISCCPLLVLHPRTRHHSATQWLRPLLFSRAALRVADLEQSPKRSKDEALTRKLCLRCCAFRDHRRTNRSSVLSLH